MKIAICSASGVGDGLLMMIAGHQIQKTGAEVVFFHPKAPLLAPLFPNTTFKFPPKDLSFINEFDRIFAQNDNGKWVWDLMRHRELGKCSQLVVIHPKPCALMSPKDFLFDPTIPFASNMAIFCSNYLHKRHPSKTNGLIVDQFGVLSKHYRRVAIHPTSADPLRNWHPHKFIEIGKLLRHLGLDPVFVMSDYEAQKWEYNAFDVCGFHSLEEAALFLRESGYFVGNDSGLGHLASNVGTPTLTISGNHSHVRIWRPNWSHGLITTPKLILPNFKGIGWPYRDLCWQRHVPVRRVWRHFKRLMHG